MIELCACINDPTKGVPGVIADAPPVLISTNTSISVTSVPNDGSCVAYYDYEMVVSLMADN